MSASLFAALASALATPEIDQKLALTAAIADDWLAGRLDWQDATPVDLVCGRPPRPELVPPRQVPQRSAKSPEGRARLLHAIVHIEFSAINLALDHAARFRGMPRQYYAEWISVAAEEARHFTILRQRLRELGHDYGDFAAHAGLWDMAEKTGGDVLARMALVPRLLEARGLDATPPLRQKLAEAGDQESARLLDIILRDEIGHVAIGDVWYRWACARQGLDPEAHYRELLRQHRAPRPRPPLNWDARRLAGFSERELQALSADQGSAED